jgi:hypothetical protein
VAKATTYKATSTATAKSKTPSQKAKAGGRYKFKPNVKDGHLARL